MKNVELAEKLAKEHPGKKYWFTGETKKEDMDEHMDELEVALERSVKEWKYTDVSDEHFSSITPLRQIIALCDIYSPATGKIIVKKGTIGGYIENEDSLSQDGSCFVCEGAYVFAGGKVSENAIVGRPFLPEKLTPEERLMMAVFPEVICFRACVCGNSYVCDSVVRDAVVVSGNARIISSCVVGYYLSNSGITEITGNACLTETDTYGAVKVKDNAKVYKAVLTENAFIDGDAKVGISKNESEILLKQLGIKLVYGTTYVSNNAHVGGRAIVDSSSIEGNAVISENARVFNNVTVLARAVIDGRAKVSKGAIVQGDAHIGGRADVVGGKVSSGEILE